MVRESNVNGRRRFTGTSTDIALATAWAQAVCHIAFGPVEGERRFKSLPAERVLTLWARWTASPTEA